MPDKTTNDEFGFVTNGAPDCNWGDLTSYAILELEFDQGTHAADPSGDGRGPEGRAGLANVVEHGNIFATCALIESLLPPQDDLAF